jgi:hypothetical protein
MNVGSIMTIARGVMICNRALCLLNGAVHFLATHASSVLGGKEIVGSVELHFIELLISLADACPIRGVLVIG